MRFMISLLIPLSVLCSFTLLNAQQLRQKKGEITFFSSAPLENIQAKTTSFNSVLEVETKKIAFFIPIASFVFDKKLMQEHFNENYMESNTFPSATFSGVLSALPQEDGKKQVTAIGTLTIHGVAQEVEVKGSVQKTKQGFQLEAKWKVKLKDYNIKIPKMLWQNIAEEIEISLNTSYENP